MIPWGIVLGLLAALAADLPPQRAVKEPRWQGPAALAYSVDEDLRGAGADSLNRDRTLVARAAAAWAPALPMPLREAALDEPDIEIHFVRPPDPHCKGREVGNCRTTFDPESGSLVHAECWIDEDVAADVLQHTIEHEMGHALGLQAHSNDSDDVMYPECRSPAGEVTPTDVSRMRELYK